MYEVIRVKWEPNAQEDIKEVYRMFKDQERKIFPLTTYDEGTTVMDMVELMCKEDFVFLIKDNGIPCAVFILERPEVYKVIITRVDIHCAIRRHYWGTKARERCHFFRRY